MSKLYVIRHKVTGNPIGVDMSSGGCPFEADIQSARFWRTTSEAIKYMNVCKREAENWELCEFKYTLEPIEKEG